MTRHERLMRTLRGETVDRPAVCFYEVNGLDQNPDDPDSFNIYNHPSWRSVVELARERSDRIVLRGAHMIDTPPDPCIELTTSRSWEDCDSRVQEYSVRAGNRTLRTVSRRDPNVDTIWTIEHLLKDTDDAEAWLELPRAEFGGEAATEHVLQAEEAIGDSGIAGLDTADPLCIAASLFSMDDYTVIALTEPELFRRILERCAEKVLPTVEAVAKALPGRLWRIYGPEYASPPYLPPRLFREYVVPYVTEMVRSIHRYGGFARVHCHGNINLILDDIAATGCAGLDPIEPPPQGDIQLREVRERVGKQIVLFGNLEASDLETLPLFQWKAKVLRALEEGTSGEGRGFVLMPSACPYGRQLAPQVLPNYQAMIETAENWSN
jgi:hypothetical protein